MAELNFSDLIGKALDVYTTREKSKIDSRLAQSTIQAQQYEQTWRMQQAQMAADAQKRAVPMWVWPVMLIGGGLVLYKVMR